MHVSDLWFSVPRNIDKLPCCGGKAGAGTEKYQEGRTWVWECTVQLAMLVQGLKTREPPGFQSVQSKFSMLVRCFKTRNYLAVRVYSATVKRVQDQELPGCESVQLVKRVQGLKTRNYLAVRVYNWLNGYRVWRPGTTCLWECTTG